MSAEPSMEEILSSIKRIIAEEGEGPVRSRRAPRTQPAPVPAPEPSYFDDEDAEVLELSDPIPAAYEAPVDEAPVEDVVTMAQPHVEPQLASIRSATPPARPTAPAPTAAPAAAGPILSDRTAQASRSALDNLTRLVAQPEAAAERSDDGSLEAVVRSMLRPMLRDWLDEHLPAMVEEMVASEIARITSQPR